MGIAARGASSFLVSLGAAMPYIVAISAFYLAVKHHTQKVIDKNLEIQFQLAEENRIMIEGKNVLEEIEEIRRKGIEAGKEQIEIEREILALGEEKLKSAEESLKIRIKNMKLAVLGVKERKVTFWGEKQEKSEYEKIFDIIKSRYSKFVEDEEKIKLKALEIKPPEEVRREDLEYIKGVFENIRFRKWQKNILKTGKLWGGDVTEEALYRIIAYDISDLDKMIERYSTIEKLQEDADEKNEKLLLIKQSEAILQEKINRLKEKGYIIDEDTFKFYKKKYEAGIISKPFTFAEKLMAKDVKVPESALKMREEILSEANITEEAYKKMGRKEKEYWDLYVYKEIYSGYIKFLRILSEGVGKESKKARKILLGAMKDYKKIVDRWIRAGESLDKLNIKKLRDEMNKKIAIVKAKADYGFPTELDEKGEKGKTSEQIALEQKKKRLEIARLEYTELYKIHSKLIKRKKKLEDDMLKYQKKIVDEEIKLRKKRGEMISLSEEKKHYEEKVMITRGNIIKWTRWLDKAKEDYDKLVEAGMSKEKAKEESRLGRYELDIKDLKKELIDYNEKLDETNKKIDKITSGMRKYKNAITKARKESERINKELSKMELKELPRSYKVYKQYLADWRKSGLKIKEDRKKEERKAEKERMRRDLDRKKADLNEFLIEQEKRYQKAIENRGDTAWKQINRELQASQEYLEAIKARKQALEIEFMGKERLKSLEEEIYRLKNSNKKVDEDKIARLENEYYEQKRLGDLVQKLAKKEISLHKKVIDALKRKRDTFVSSMEQVWDDIYALTHTQEEIELREITKKYNKLKEMAEDNAKELLDIDKWYYLQKKKIRDKDKAESVEARKGEFTSGGMRFIGGKPFPIMSLEQAMIDKSSFAYEIAKFREQMEKPIGGSKKLWWLERETPSRFQTSIDAEIQKSLEEQKRKKKELVNQMNAEIKNMSVNSKTVTIKASSVEVNGKEKSGRVRMKKESNTSPKSSQPVSNSSQFSQPANNSSQLEKNSYTPNQIPTIASKDIPTIGSVSMTDWHDFSGFLY